MNLAIAIGMTILLGLFYSWTSRINGLFFFGRSVAAEMKGSPEARAITRQYIAAIAVATAVAVLSTWAAMHFAGRHLAIVGVLVLCLGFTIAFARANRQTTRVLQERADWRSPTQLTREAALLQQPRYWIPGPGAIAAPLVAALVITGIAITFTPHAAGLVSAFNSFGASVGAHGDDFVLGMACGMMAAATSVLLLFRASVRLRTRMAQYSIRSSFSMLCIGSALLIGTLVSNLAGVTMSRSFGKGLVIVALASALGILVWNQARANRFVPSPVEMGSDNRWHWGCSTSIAATLRSSSRAVAASGTR